MTLMVIYIFKIRQIHLLVVLLPQIEGLSRIVESFAKAIICFST